MSPRSRAQLKRQSDIMLPYTTSPQNTSNHIPRIMLIVLGNVLAVLLLCGWIDSVSASEQFVHGGISAECEKQPWLVHDTTTLNASIVCFNHSPAGHFEISITAPFTLITHTQPISNASDANLKIYGNDNLIDGNQTFGIFSIHKGNVTIENISLQNGKGRAYSPYHVGGALIVNSGAIVTLSNSIVLSNTAANGGAIYMLGGSLSVLDSEFVGNSVSRQGGAISREAGSLVVIRSVFARNHAGSGGAIYTKRSLTVRDSSFISNTAGTGGAIYNSIASLTVNNSSFNENRASSKGGAIYSKGSSLIIADSHVKVTNSTFYSNSTTTDDGSTLYNLYGSLTVNNSTFYRNSAARFGAIYSFSGSGDVYVVNSTFYENVSNRLTGQGGIAHIFVSSGRASLRNSIVANPINGGSCYGISSYPSNISTATTSGKCGNHGIVDSAELGPFADNGCATPRATLKGLTCVKTFALLENSPAIDAGNNATCLSADQRGMQRFDADPSAICDAGAYEAIAVNPTVAALRDAHVETSQLQSNTHIFLPLLLLTLLTSRFIRSGRFEFLL